MDEVVMEGEGLLGVGRRRGCDGLMVILIELDMT